MRYRLGWRQCGQPFGLGLHEAAANRIKGFHEKRIVVVVENAEHHAIGMPGKGRTEIEDDILDWIEGQHITATQGDAGFFCHCLEHIFNPVGINAVGCFARQPQDHGAAGAMTLAGEGERTIEPDGQASGERQ